MGSGAASSEDETGQVVETTTDLLRRSAEVLRAMDESLNERRRVLEAADTSLTRANRLLTGVDIDLTAPERPSDGPTERVRVLVVDDNSTIRDVVRLLMQVEFGDQVAVRCVPCGVDALASVEWAPHVAIVDWVMPHMDGLETCRRLRAQLPHARILLYSSRLAADGEPEAAAAGADRYIEKGADTVTLIDEIRAVMARNERRVRSSHATG